MGVLAEYLKAEAEQLKTEKVKRRAEVSEWVEALNNLFEQMQKWLVECDPDKLIEHTIEHAPGRDLTLGEHKVPVFKLTLGNRSWRFEPVARYMAATVRPPGQDKPVKVRGGVEFVGLGGRTCYLFLLPDGKWYIQSENENLRVSGNDVVPLNADRFEAVVRESF